MDEAALNRLADAAGLEPRYWDIQGHLHERSARTARRLLGALGIAAETDAQIAASLTMLAEEPWRESLPPVIVAREGDEIDVPVRLPAHGAARRLRWTVELEAGGYLAGECDIGALVVESQGEADGAPIALRHLKLPAQPMGYHRLRLEGARETSATLIIAPPRCHLPPGRRRYWGVAAQLYALRSKGNWGIGDFGDLGALIEWSAARGAAAVGINPLHALFLDAPRDASPYAPNSRLFLNPLYLDVTAVPGFAQSTKARAIAQSDALRSVRDNELVNYPAVTALKLAVLEQLHREFLEGPEEGMGALHDFIKMRGSELHRFATFQMLSEHFATHDWRRWPAACRDPAPNDIDRLANSNAARVSFFEFLQWQCDVQLGAAVERGRALGMPLGLYGDLAVSVDAVSADHWAHQDIFLCEARVGAPPDPFNQNGQEWGVVPPSPRRLRVTGYAHFISLLRAAMRHTRALRIDHVMGWERLFVIPAGASPAEGAYLRFPRDDLVAIAALESTRNQCVLIGEDLGTVPIGFRKRMAEANILSYQVLYFERDHDRFRRSAEFPQLATVCAATHDLPTLRGYWTSDDIAARAKVGLLPSPEDEARKRWEREDDKRLLMRALADECLLPNGVDPAVGIEWSPELGYAIHAYLARAPSVLMMVQLDDLADEQHQANLPGTTNAYPNWRRRLHHSLEYLSGEASVGETVAAVDRERGAKTS